jgi:hypothetical protein
MSAYEPALYNNNTQKKNKVKDQSTAETCSLYMVTHLIISFFAIYLSWRCNNNFNILSFASALICPYLYIIWALATSGGCGIFGEVAQQCASFPIRILKY